MYTYNYHNSQSTTPHPHNPYRTTFSPLCDQSQAHSQPYKPQNPLLYNIPPSQIRASSQSTLTTHKTPYCITFSPLRSEPALSQPYNHKTPYCITFSPLRSGAGSQSTLQPHVTPLLYNIPALSDQSQLTVNPTTTKNPLLYRTFSPSDWGAACSQPTTTNPYCNIQPLSDQESAHTPNQ
ncbi:hypothetical protein RRG08_022783 [Elysia crispata]|uniref:Uncharacterized protein n=1 Tax=Elysia crispata TaxID=231223 RepID=A0AAE1B211_9GAST|nr:hypothetical protein RRG08_022783 [Elysia crispata]